MELRDEDIAERIMAYGFRGTVEILMRYGWDEREAIRKVREIHERLDKGEMR